METVLLYETENQIELGKVKSILDEHNIVYYVKNEHTQNLLSGTALVSGYDVVAGSMRLYVSDTELDKALEILEDYLPAKEVIEETPYDYNVNNSEKETLDENRSDIVKLVLLVMSSYILAPSLYAIKYYLRLRGKKRNLKIVLGIIQAVLSIMGISAIAGKSPLGDIVISYSVLFLLILSLVKGISFLWKKKYLLSFLCLIPIMTASIFMLITK